MKTILTLSTLATLLGGAAYAAVVPIQMPELADDSISSMIQFDDPILDMMTAVRGVDDDGDDDHDGNDGDFGGYDDGDSDEDGDEGYGDDGDDGEGDGDGGDD